MAVKLLLNKYDHVIELDDGQFVVGKLAGKKTVYTTNKTFFASLPAAIKKFCTSVAADQCTDLADYVKRVEHVWADIKSTLSDKGIEGET